MSGMLLTPKLIGNLLSDLMVRAGKLGVHDRINAELGYDLDMDSHLILFGGAFKGFIRVSPQDLELSIDEFVPRFLAPLVAEKVAA